ncbi:MAG: YggS family pyridoxal phosphate-dependent enzyme [Actinomycetes bacterium]
MTGVDPGRAAELAANLAEVRDRVAAAARRAGRDPASVRLVGASKTVGAEELAVVVRLGLVELGENRAQELLAKAPVLAGLDAAPTWHFVGRLQRNKVGALSPYVALWHTVDRLPLGEVIARRAPGARVLVEVNLGEEPQKGGAAPSEVPALVDGLAGLGLDVAGLMTVAPLEGEPARWFDALAGLAARLGLAELSMGMSGDFETAIAHGATIVRVGTALFGSRPRA